MPSPNILDFETLLAPIVGDNPAGSNLREDRSPLAVYQMVKGARQQARAAERQAMNEGLDPTSVKGEWRPILEQGPKLIAEQSKDIEIAAWLTEALVREKGFAGLRDGFKLARELVERYWDNLYPLPNEDGIVDRCAPLAGLNGVDAEGTLAGPLNMVPLLDGGGGSAGGPLGRAAYKQAADLEGITDPDRRSSRISSGAVTMEMIEKAVRDSSPDFLREVYGDVRACIDEFEKLSAALDERCGPDAPPTSAVRSLLDECREIMENVAGNVLGIGIDPSMNGSANGDPAHGDGDGGGAGARVGGGGQLHTRDEAFQSLLRVAQFFKQTEPHSPISYALEQAVRWGRMPLPELWAELIGDESARREVFKLVGISPPPGDS